MGETIQLKPMPVSKSMSTHGDEVHEAPRASLSPEVRELIKVARDAGALHAARSGAGPSVIAVASNETADRVAEAFRNWGAQVVTGPVETTGLI